MIKPKDLPAPKDKYPIRRALLSAFDKTGLVPFAQRLGKQGVELISTGGTARALRDAGLEVTDVAELTGYPEILDGRVKTLHPAVHAGLLARRNDEDDMKTLEDLAVEPIDLVVVNIYPFEEAVRRGAGEEEAVENIDIGGPTMMRAAAKNFFFLGVVTSPDQYDDVAQEIEDQKGRLTLRTRRRLASEAFRRTAEYDRAITDFVVSQGMDETVDARPLPSTLNVHLPRQQALRYGENPHQEAALYGDAGPYYEKLHGKELSFNNLLDVAAALQLIDEFSSDVPTCAIIKHTNPCGVAMAGTLDEAYGQAFATDRQSPFGGIIVVNRALDRATAEAVDQIFSEIIIAPEFEEGVMDFLQQKEKRRIIRSLGSARGDRSPDVRSVVGGLLIQSRDEALPSRRELRHRLRVVSRRPPTDEEWDDVDFAWRVAKHVKSNAIVYAKDRRTLGIGAGQMSRIDASEIAVMKSAKSELALDGAVVASDAFFPFADGLVVAARNGARAVIQPGGSIRDDEVIDAANEHDMAMVFTGNRHFRH